MWCSAGSWCPGHHSWRRKWLTWRPTSNWMPCCQVGRRHVMRLWWGRWDGCGCHLQPGGGGVGWGGWVRVYNDWWWFFAIACDCWCCVSLVVVFVILLWCCRCFCWCCCWLWRARWRSRECYCLCHIVSRQCLPSTGAINWLLASDSMVPFLLWMRLSIAMVVPTHHPSSKPLLIRKSANCLASDLILLSLFLKNRWTRINR